MAEEDVKLEDSNLAGIGSDMDKQLRQAAADAEPEFDGAGSEPGLEIWRIEKFEPVKVRDEKEFGIFYKGDCYIVLNTYQKDGSDALLWDLHYWIGADSTQDEQGSVAYFCVNLDDKLGTKPVQYREVMGSESAKFMSFFDKYMLVDGGVASGFTSPEPETYETKLFHVTGKGTDVKVNQEPLALESLNRSDVFILDCGMTLFQWNSVGCGAFERMAGCGVLERISALRNHEPEEHNIDGEEIMDRDDFWEKMGCDKPDLNELPSAPVAEEVEEGASRRLYKISDENGEMVCSLVQEVEEGALDSGLTDEEAIMCAVVGDKHAIFYLGKHSSQSERFYLNMFTGKLLNQCGLPEFAPTTMASKESAKDEWAALF
ncbi:Severin [Porphyridium purpureum]|uniref:Severin n=1 Tax=Porphyridium purpureum TaxID=35688 RepID=A0A5J4Z3W6_PORPP|nr:Severin [Porphyridium purpureum]|eukprot:POR7517..scf295_1